MTDQQKVQIQADAERAANMGWTPNQMCPHPFSSEQGRYWTNCYWAMWDKLRGTPSEFDGYLVDRRGK